MNNEILMWVPPKWEMKISHKSKGFLNIVEMVSFHDAIKRFEWAQRQQKQSELFTEQACWALLSEMFSSFDRGLSYIGWIRRAL